MRKLFGFASVLSIGAALLAAPALNTSVSAGGNQTGQGIMVNLKAGGSYAINGTQQYRFNRDTAATYFTNEFDGTVDVACNGSPAACAPSNQPATPSAPTPDAEEVVGNGQGKNGVAGAQECRFLDGLTLNGGGYTRDVTANGLDGKGNWKFTFHYSITPTTADPVAPFTAWDLEKDDTAGDGLAHVPVAADIAGESVLKSSNAKLGTKYSFSLRTTCLDGNGVPYTCSRVVNLALSVDGGTPIPATSQMFENVPGSTPYAPGTGAVDFLYATNAGSNGNTSLLRDADARCILSGGLCSPDIFKGNDNGGADGSALAIEKMNALQLDLGEGAHTITLTGTVKGNSIDGASTGASISFTITKNVHVVTPGCGQSQQP